MPRGHRGGVKIGASGLLAATIAANKRAHEPMIHLAEGGSIDARFYRRCGRRWRGGARVHRAARNRRHDGAANTLRGADKYGARERPSRVREHASKGTHVVR